MNAFYLFSLVLGGGFLALSVFGDLFGGHGDVDFGDIDVDVDMDLDAGGVDMDMDAGGDVDMGGHAGDVDASHAHHLGGSVAAKIFSIRTVTYSLFGFGAVGTLLTWLWDGGAPGTTATLAVATGLTSGALINTVFVWLKRSESGAMAGESGYAGHRGRVTLPIAGSGGKVLVEFAGREVELRALPHPSALEAGDPATWKRVVVVEMEAGVARVAPLDDEPLLNP